MFDDDYYFEQADKMYKQLFRDEEPILASVYMMDIKAGWDCATDAEHAEIFKSMFGVDYNPSLLIYELCNYKGEGDDGYAVGDDALKYPVFKSKSHSFDMF